MIVDIDRLRGISSSNFINGYQNTVGEMRSGVDYSICQSMGFLFLEIKKALVCENGLLPKNPLLADRGLG